MTDEESVTPIEVRRNPENPGQVAIAVEGVAYGNWFVYDNTSRGFYSDGVREDIENWLVSS